MNLANSFLASFLSGKYDAKDFIIAQLESNNTQLSKFLVKEFKSKKIKADLEKLEQNHQTTIAFGKQTEWRLIDNRFYKGQFKGAEYVVPIVGKLLAIAAIKK